MDMVADRVIETRRTTWEWESDGLRTARTLGIASLGGATLDNEDGLSLTGMSYDNTQGLGASTWRHVAFIEQQAPAPDGRTQLPLVDAGSTAPGEAGSCAG